MKQKLLVAEQLLMGYGHIICFLIAAPLVYSFLPQMGFMHEFGFQNDLIRNMLLAISVPVGMLFGLILKLVVAYIYLKVDPSVTPQA